LKLIKSKKNNKAEIKKIKGKISNKIDGELEKVKIKGNKKFTSKSLKKEISSNEFKTIIRVRKIIETLNIFFKNFFIKNFL